jgi:Yip1 domain
MATTALPSQEQTPLSETQRLVDVFVAPSKTFTDLRRSASWWAPFLISVIVSVAFVYVADQKVGFRNIAENQLRTQPKQADQVERMPADQREKNMQVRTTFTKAISYGFSAFILIWYVIVASILLATLKFGLGAEVKFKTLFALVVYASLPGLLKAILASVSLLAGVAGDAFTFQDSLASNPGYFVDAATNPVLHGFLSSFDVFGFWTMILGAIGITCISKVKTGAAFAVVFGWFAVLVVIGVGFAAAFS